MQAQSVVDMRSDAGASCNAAPIDVEEDSLVGEPSAVDETLKDVSDRDLASKCSAIKLAARVVEAMPHDVRLDGSKDAENSLIRALDGVLKRVSEIRSMTLSVINPPEKSADYPHVFNAATGVALDLLAHEQRLRRIHGDDAEAPSLDVFSVLMDRCAKLLPERLDCRDSESLDVMLARRLAILQIAPRMLELTTIFDYFQADQVAMQMTLWKEVKDKSEEAWAQIAGDSHAQDGRLLLKTYRVVADVMCAVYRKTACRDAETLARMVDGDRSLLISRYEQDGGMRYDHVIDAFRETLETFMTVYGSMIHDDDKGAQG